MEIFRTSAEIDKLTAALAEAQREIKGATKDKLNPHFNRSYADLSSVWESWQEVGPKNGLALTQAPLDPEQRQGILLSTLLAHTSGQFIHAISFFPAIKQDPQAYGSALTYARRYSLAAMVGVAPEDDDANAAAGKGPATQRSPGSFGSVEDFRKKAEEAFTKHRDNIEKLLLIRGEAEKSNLVDLVLCIDERVKDLSKPKEAAPDAKAVAK